MQSRLMRTQGGRIFAIIFEAGEEVQESLLDFARRTGVQSARFSAVGALREATVAYFDAQDNQYKDKAVDEQVEVASFAGNLARHEGETMAHIHCVLGRRDGSAVAGHFRRGVVRPTLEMFLEELAFPLERKKDPRTGLPLIRMD